MIDNTADCDPLDRLAEEFVARHRRGERPTVTEYADRHPELAAEVRELFPALVLMEDANQSAGDRAAPAAVPGLDPGHARLGDYRLVREVGRGGMGVVYEAEQESLGRHVALKLLPAHTLPDSVRLLRFHREARAAAKLHHTNIVPVFGVGEADGQHFYVMQYIRGLGLDQVLTELRDGRVATTATGGPAADAVRSLAGGRFDTATPADAASVRLPGGDEPTTTGLGREYWRSVARVGVQVADALQYAHDQGVLHRDIKPSNLLLDTHGTVWVTDFGLAKSVGSDDLTHPGDVLGTLRYLAPERLDGNADARSDVFGLGVTLYELATRRPAFGEADRGRLVKQIGDANPVRPRAVDPAIPRDLETVILKAMAREPGRRYQTAGELADDLRQFLADRTIKARRAGPGERLARWGRRNPTVAGLVTMLALLLVGGAVGGLTAADRFRLQRNVAQRVADDLADANREKDRRLWEALVAEADALRRGRRNGQRFATLDKLREAVELARRLDLSPADTLRMRNVAAAALALPDLYVGPPWLADVDDLPGGGRWDYDADLTVVAAAEPGGQVVLRRIVDRAELARVPGELCSLAPDAHHLVAVELGRTRADNRLRVWRIDGPSPTAVLDVRGRRAAAFHPSGDRVVCVEQDGGTGLDVYDLTTGRRLFGLPAADAPREPQAAFHPTEPLLAVTSFFSPTIRVYDLGTGRPVARFAPDKKGNNLGGWDAAGRLLAVASSGGGGHGTVRLIEHGTWRTVRTMPTRWPDEGNSPLFHPAGGRLLARGWNYVPEVFDCTTGLAEFEGVPAPGGVVRFDRTGDRLAGLSVGGRVGVAQVALGREYRTLAVTTDTSHGFAQAAVHPGGRLAAVGTAAGFRLFDLDAGAEVGAVETDGYGGHHRLVFDPAGGLLVCGHTGLFRWPIGPDPAAPGRLRVGPPEQVGTVSSSSTPVVSRDGQVVAVAVRGAGDEVAFRGGWVFHADRPGRPVRAGVGEDLYLSAVSPDGRLFAARSHETLEVGVWDARTGELIRRLGRSGWALAFTPDGDWLVAGRKRWRTTDWAEEPAVAGRLSADGRLAADTQPDGPVRLVRTIDGVELARLDAPDAEPLNDVTFSPDGTRLVGCSQFRLLVWDLARLRAGLDRLKLDWGEPPLAPPPPAVPLTVEVVGQELVADKMRDTNHRAWLLVSGPADKRDPAQALTIITDLVRRRPNDGAFLNTLGLVQYRNKLYREAVATLEWSLALGGGSHDAFDLYVLAMCHARLGDPAAARDRFDRAKRWHAAKWFTVDEANELKQFRAEAEAELIRLQ